jgi:photosystem II stability/assembly factor-like uncharacterized protein
MMGHGRQVLIIALAALIAAARAIVADTPLDARPDAQLTDVFFLDADRGWAVGDRGTILATTNGGQEWHAQKSPTTPRLESVWFVDANTGWAAGGMATPYSSLSSGVVLHTTDGGRTWAPLTKTPLPRLRSIRMFDQRGWAAGESNSVFPAGVFSTTDGGRTWSSVPATRFESWTSGHFFSPHAALLIGRQSRVARIDRGRLDGASLNLPNPSTPRKIALMSNQRGWLVGDRGLVRMTHDDGRTWRSPTGELPALAKSCDFSALSARDQSVWIAGSPGSVVWHSADGGRTWAVHPTGQNVPIQSLCFVDRHRGWAVGELGTILATRDGGKSWRVQRRGGERAAVMFIFAQPGDVPLALVADVAESDGYFAVVSHLERAPRRSETAPDDALDRRAADAFAALGATATEALGAFPVPREAQIVTANDIIAEWDALHGGASRDALASRVAQSLRTWRPSVVVTHSPDTAAEGLGHVINQAVLAAVEHAAGTGSSNHEQGRLGLDRWPVSKVYGLAATGDQGTYELATAKMLVGHARSLADQAARAAGQLNRELTPQPAAVRLVQLVDRTPGGRSDLMAGISSSSLTRARRTMTPNAGAAESLRALKQQAAARRNAQALLEYARRRGDSAGAWLGRIDELTRGLDDVSRAEVITQLAQTFEETGQWDLARELYGVLAKREAAGPLAQVALAWVVAHESSGEVRRRMRGHAGYPVVQAAAQSPASAASKTKPRSALEELAERVDKAAAAWSAEPHIQLPLAVALRQAGDVRESQRRNSALTSSRPHDIWRSFAAGESWLADRKGKPPVPIVKCPRTGQRPRLDGKLDEPFWSSSEPVSLVDVRHPTAGRPTQVRFARDESHLYLGIECRKAKSVSYDRDPAAARRRDADLSARDRVIIRLDMDRDLVTHYTLSIDDRGWGADALGRDSAWDPKWFIAAGGDPTSWTIEAAIPWGELADPPPKPHDAWCVGLQRVVPGVGFQSLSPTADPDEAAESFGYLLFE